MSDIRRDKARAALDRSRDQLEERERLRRRSREIRRELAAMVLPRPKGKG